MNPNLSAWLVILRKAFNDFGKASFLSEIRDSFYDFSIREAVASEFSSFDVLHSRDGEVFRGVTENDYTVKPLEEREQISHFFSGSPDRADSVVFEDVVSEDSARILVGKPDGIFYAVRGEKALDEF